MAPQNRPMNVLLVDAERKAVRLGEAPWVKLSNRATLWRIVSFLVRKRREAPGQGASLYELVSATYPDETLMGEAASNRIYYSLSTLRKMGLREVLARNEEGYLIPESLQIRATAPDASLVGPSMVPHQAKDRLNYALPSGLFVGRKRQLAQVDAALAQGNAVAVLLGPGGAGKTRLAKHVGFQMRHMFPGGVRLCECHMARESASLLSVMARTLNISIAADDVVAHVGEVLERRGANLLILDNVEQVVADAAQLISSLRALAPLTRFIVTSRLRLPLAEVAHVEVASLELDSALALFEARSRMVNADFAIDDHDADLVAQLINSLDRLPLALELAASCTRSLTPSQIVHRLPNHFRLLRSRTQDRPSRHTSLKTVMDWSWELASPVERVALAQCSVFRGGFTMEAAEATLELGHFEEAWTDDVIERLLDHSLIYRTDSQTDGSRFALYASVHAYVDEKLATPGALPFGLSGPDAKQDAEARHCKHFADLGSFEVLRRLHLKDGAALRLRIAQERDNLEKAIASGLAHGHDALVASAWDAVFWGLYSLRGPFEFLAHRARQLAEEMAPAHRAAVLMTLSHCLSRQGNNVEAGQVARQVLDLAPNSLDPYIQAKALSMLSRERLLTSANSDGIGLAIEAHKLFLQCDAFYEAHFEQYRVAINYYDAGRVPESEAVCRELKQRLLDHQDLRNLAALNHLQHRMAHEAGQLKEACQLLERSIELYADVGDHRNRALSLAQRAGLCSSRGEGQDDFLTWIEPALKLSEEIGSRLNMSICHIQLGTRYMELKQFSLACEHLERALHLSPTDNNKGRFLLKMKLGWSLANLGEMTRAEQFLSEAEAGLAPFPGFLCHLIIIKHDVALINGDLPSAETALEQGWKVIEELGLEANSPVTKDFQRRRDAFSALRLQHSEVGQPRSDDGSA